MFFFDRFGSIEVEELRLFLSLMIGFGLLVGLRRRILLFLWVKIWNEGRLRPVEVLLSSSVFWACRRRASGFLLSILSRSSSLQVGGDSVTWTAWLDWFCTWRFLTFPRAHECRTLRSSDFLPSTLLMRDFGDDLDSMRDRFEAKLPSAKKPGGNLRAAPDFFLIKVFSISF